jgi:hypothetical protein
MIMSSDARQAFDKSCHDIDRLLEIHGQLTPSGPGRGYLLQAVSLEVLNKSAIVLISAIWEAYCEDIVSESLKHLVEHSTNSSTVSNEMKKTIAKELKQDKNELAIWQIADNGWKAILVRMAKMRALHFNTPKSENIKDFFREVLGIDDILETWSWEKMSPSEAAKTLDKFITMRGDIAHRGIRQQSVTKSEVQNFLEHIRRLVHKTDAEVNGHLKEATGQSLW